jgi:hypothetical protein
MAACMRRLLAPGLLALLVACRQTAPADPDGAAIAHAGAKSTETARLVQEKNSAAKLSGTSDNPAPGTQATPGASTAAVGAAGPVAVDANQKREYADVYVDMTDPSGQKGLVSYLLKPEEWYVEKVVQLTPTTKHWRFWRILRTDGKALPEVDPLRPRR